VARIAADNMDMFRDVAVNRHLLHDYSAQSALNCEMVCYFYTRRIVVFILKCEIV